MWFGGRRTRDGVYCSATCENFDRVGGFCRACWDETIAESAGDCRTVNGVGTTLEGWAGKCPDCGSVIQTKYWTLVSQGRFRVLYTQPSRYLSRRLKPPGRQRRSRERDDDDRPARRTLRECRYCGSDRRPIVRERTAPAGWAFVVLFSLFCFPLLWVGLLIKEQRLVCPDCGEEKLS